MESLGSRPSKIRGWWGGKYDACRARHQQFRRMKKLMMIKGNDDDDDEDDDVHDINFCY